MGRAEQHGAERRELLERHLLRPVAVVDVEVDDGDTLAVGGDRVRGADPDVVEEAEAVAAGDLVPPVDHRVVPRRAHQAEGRVRRLLSGVGEHAVDRRDDRARDRRPDECVDECLPPPSDNGTSAIISSCSRSASMVCGENACTTLCAA